MGTTRAIQSLGGLRPHELQTLPSVWRSAPRRWGHSLHSLCSYMAMFPPTLPHTFINWLTDVGDVVYDPFSGRGTTVLEACLQQRIGLGSDANPLAWLLSSAKANPPTKSEVNSRLVELRKKSRSLETTRVPLDIRAIFHKETLGQLMWLRRELSPANKVDRFLLAVLLGGIHANADSAGYPRGLTVSMPNTFAMSPRYVRQYIKEHKLTAPRKDVVSFLEARANNFELPESTFQKGRAWQQDVTKALKWPSNTSNAKLIFTSPPYLQVMRYAKLNWIRHWVIGDEPKKVDANLFTSASLPKYIDFMSAALTNFRSVLRDDGFICLVIGDVRRKDTQIRLAEIVAQSCLADLDLKPVSIIEDRLPTKQKVSRIWGDTKGRATKTDRLILLAAKKAKVPRNLPAASWG